MVDCRMDHVLIKIVLADYYNKIYQNEVYNMGFYFTTVARMIRTSSMGRS